MIILDVGRRPDRWPSRQNRLLRRNRQDFPAASLTSRRPARILLFTSQASIQGAAHEVRNRAKITYRFRLPLSPVLRGERVGVRGDRIPRDNLSFSRFNPPHPRPSCAAPTTYPIAPGDRIMKHQIVLAVIA